MHRLGRKALVAVVVAGGLVVGAAAYAYWTTTGSGSGTAAVGTNATITVVQTSVISGLAPGVTAQTLAGTFANTAANNSDVHIATLGVTVASTSAGAGCDASDFTVAGDMTNGGLGWDVPKGSTNVVWTGPTIAFKNDAARNQDVCKLATVNLAYTAA